MGRVSNAEVQGWLESIDLGDKYGDIEGYLTTDPQGQKRSWKRDLQSMLETAPDEENRMGVSVTARLELIY